MPYTSDAGLILPDSLKPLDEIEQSYGEGRRRSTPLNIERQTYYPRVHPDGNGSLRMSRIDANKLVNRHVKEVIRILAKAAASMSDAVDLWRQYINAGHYWETETSRDERILKNMEGRVTMGGASMQTIIGQVVWGQVVEGAVCVEITGNMVEGITQIDAVSPLELTFVQDNDPKRGVVDIIGQGVGANFRSLQDPRAPNPYFVYDPVSNDATEPWGAIPFLPGIAAEIMHAGLFTKTDQYLDGQIFPKGYFSFDIGQLTAAGLDGNTIREWVNESVTELQGEMNSTDPSRAVISKVPTLWTLVGSTGKVNLDGLEMLDRIISRNLNRAYKVPSFLFDGGNTNGFNSSKERNEMLLWLRRVRNHQRMNEAAFTQFGNKELEIQGSRNECQFKLDDTDLEGERIIAEKDKLQADARKAQAEADKVNIQNGTISREEARITLVSQDTRYEELDAEKLPEMPEPAPQPQAQPTGEFAHRHGPHCNHTHSVVDFAATISPDGSDDPLPQVPTEVEITTEMLQMANSLWNSLMDEEYADLLQAQVTDVQASDVIDSLESDWEWSLADETYTKGETSIDKDKQIQLRDAFTDAVKPYLAAIADGLEDGRKSVQQWVLEMRTAVRDTHVVQFLFGKGGANTLYENDLTALGGLVLTQYGFLQAFAEVVRSGLQTLRQIRARARNYGESSTRPYSEGRARSFGFTLPNYPADGTMECLIRCRCHWRIEKENETTYNCYWTLDPLAQHCQTCLRYSRDYNPYVATVGG